MKKLVFSLVVLAAVFSSTFASAQANVSFNISIQPAWGPVGYDYANYYYLPDYDVYYDLNKSQFIYLNNGRWSFAVNLPARFGKVDLYRAYKVVLNDRNPYLQNKQHRTTYAKFKGSNRQVAIRDSKEEKYFESKYHPQHSSWEARNQKGKNSRSEVTQSQSSNGKGRASNNDKGKAQSSSRKEDARRH